MKELTQEEFKTFIENKDLKIINEVSFAHGCCDAQGNHKHFKAFGHYPTEYIVTEQQINAAKALRLKLQKEAIQEHRKNNTLVFIGMGSDFAPLNNNYIGNHRVRASFINADGIMCFIEVGTLANDKSIMRCDHSIFNNATKWNSLAERDALEKNNYKDVERMGGMKYTYKSLLNLVNATFNCNFKHIELDSYLLTTDIYAGISPTKCDEGKHSFIPANENKGLGDRGTLRCVSCGCRK